MIIHGVDNKHSINTCHNIIIYTSDNLWYRARFHAYLLTFIFPLIRYLCGNFVTYSILYIRIVINISFQQYDA